MSFSKTPNCRKHRRVRKMFLEGYSVEIVGVSKPDQVDVVAYIMHVKTHKDQWTIHRRYSHFHKFRTELVRLWRKSSIYEGNEKLVHRLSTETFPRKHLFHSSKNEKIVQERTAQLNLFMTTLLKFLNKIPRSLPKDTAVENMLELTKKFLTVQLKFKEPAPSSELSAQFKNLGYHSDNKIMISSLSVSRPKKLLYSVQEEARAEFRGEELDFQVASTSYLSS